MVDLAIKISAIAAFVISLAVLAIFVPEWNLVGVLAIAIGMATYDFFIWSPRRRNGGSS